MGTGRCSAKRAEHTVDTREKRLTRDVAHVSELVGVRHVPEPDLAQGVLHPLQAPQEIEGLCRSERGQQAKTGQARDARGMTSQIKRMIWTYREVFSECVGSEDDVDGAVRVIVQREHVPPAVTVGVLRRHANNTSEAIDWISASQISLTRRTRTESRLSTSGASY